MSIPRVPAALLAALLYSIPLSTAFAEDEALLGRFNGWEAHKLDRGGQTTCYAMAKPQKSTPKGLDRDPAYFMVTNWPDRDSRNEPSIVAGYTYRDGSNVAVTVGKTKFSFFTKGDGAWLASQADEKRLMAAMRKAGSIVVRGTSSRGTVTTDHYTLTGLTRALDKIAQACK